MSNVLFDETYFDRLDEELMNETEIAVRDAAKSFMNEFFLPYIRRWDSGNLDPFINQFVLTRYFMRQTGGAGLLGANLSGLEKYIAEFEPVSELAYGLIMREIEAVDSSFRSSASVQSSLVMWGINKYGSEEQKRIWLPRLFRGEVIGAYALTEPQGGSDPLNMKTTAKRDGGGWILNGSKVWITNGSVADVVVVYAKTDSGFGGFLVEKNTPGLTTGNYEKWSLRCGVSSWLNFDNVMIPTENFLPGTADGHPKNFLSHLTQARYGICWGAVGAAISCFKEAREFALGRELFGKTLAEKQLIQERLAEMFSLIKDMYFAAYHLGKLKEKLGDKIPYQEVAQVKYSNIDKACRVAWLAVNDILPADVFRFDDMHSGRHLRGLMVVRKYEGAHALLGLVTGEAVTGVKAY